MRTRLSLILVTLTLPGLLPGAAAGDPGRYLAPVLTDGMAFPVARSDWYSVIELGNDWHAPGSAS